MSWMTRRVALTFAALLLGTTAAAAQDAPRVKLATTAGDIVVEVYPDKAPKTVENFLQYVRDRHYDGTVFHRVIDNFMVQGGGYDAGYVEKKTRSPVQHEGRDQVERADEQQDMNTDDRERSSLYPRDVALGQLVRTT